MATYSIVARDATGSLGVAVQSHWFSVGSVVPYVESGVGAVAIQSFPNPAHGPAALELLRSGIAPEEAIADLLADDPEEAFRQIAVVDSAGHVAAHTGKSCIPEAGHRTGEAFSAQANLMDRNTVWGAMAHAFAGSPGDLAERLLKGLEAAEAEGGDIRGRQSAAIVVVRSEPTGLPAKDRLFDLRVEDHLDPLAELRRLVQLRRVYMLLIEGDEFVAKGDIDAALTAYRMGMDMVTDEATGGEAAFWTGVTLAAEGRVDDSLGYLERAQSQWEGWARLVPRLTHSGILPDDPPLIGRLTERMLRAPQ